MNNPPVSRAHTHRYQIVTAIVVFIVMVLLITTHLHDAAAADGDITLTPGWNLVGWATADTPISTALAEGGAADRVTAVWGYKNAGWSAFFPSAASVPGANDLTTFVQYGGYFIAVNAGDAVVWHTGAVSTGGTPTTTTTTPSPTTTPTPVPTETVHTFGSGTLLVGTDIAPGTYRTRSATDGCYWERLSGLGGTLGEIIANDFTNGFSVVTISNTDIAFSSNDCATWTTDLAPVTTNSTAPLTGDGVYIVGVDLAPGTWKAPATDGCYWARLSNFSGKLDAIIANDFTTSAAVVAIGASDSAFETSGCGTWTKVS